MYSLSAQIRLSTSGLKRCNRILRMETNESVCYTAAIILSMLSTLTGHSSTAMHPTGIYCVVFHAFSKTVRATVISGDCQQPLRIGPPDLFLPGLVVGCSPLYGLRLSTLECLYSRTCIDDILNHLNYYAETNISEPSNSTASTESPLIITPLLHSKSVHFPPSAQIGSIMDNAFIVEIKQEISYEKYFTACGAQSCHYELIKNSDSVYVLTSLLGLYGGLTISLRFIIWNMARIHQLIKRRLRTRTTSIEPFRTGSVTHSIGAK
jgi:hypothetical protein